MATWVTDGSPELEVVGDLVSSRSYTLCNAIWSEYSIPFGEHYWKIHFKALRGGGCVGFTSRDYFEKGQALNPIMYSGDLRVGGKDEDGLLVANFGPPPTEGDVIGILAIFEEEKLHMYIDVNGNSLGLAFSVPGSTFTTIFPIVTFYEGGAATCTKQTEIPNLKIRAHESVLNEFHGIEGDWIMIEFDNVKVAENRPKCKIREGLGNNYYWNLNHMSTQIKRVNEKWESGVVTTDYKKRQPEQKEVERALERLMNYVFKVDPLENDLLDIQSLLHSSLWQREDPPKPFIGMPFESSETNSPPPARHERAVQLKPFESSEID